VFGRSKAGDGPATPTAAEQAATAATEARTGAKGRPTPTRREAEQRNRHPLGAQSKVGAVRAGASKAERKAAQAERRAAFAAERALTRQALVTGDEKHLPARDRGPARRFVRDFVDARRNVGELFIPLALVILAMSLVRNAFVVTASLVLLYSLVLASILDSVLLRRKLNRLTVAKFGDKAAGAANYGTMRALQIRRTRLPRPQVSRGQYPS
jgi:hypothetical protein